MVWMLLLIGCLDEGLELEFANHLGVGLTWTVEVRDECQVGPFCDPEQIEEIIEVVDQVEGIVEIGAVQPDAFELTGLSEGNTQVTVLALDSNREVREEAFVVAVSTIQNATLWPVGCHPTTWPNRDPVYVPPGTEVRLNWTFSDEAGQQLQGFAPFDTDLSSVDLDVFNRQISVVAPDGPGLSGTISNTAFSGVLQTITTIDSSSFDGMALRDVVDGPVAAGVRNTFEAMPTIGTHVPCVDTEVRALTAGPPEVCSLDGTLGVQEATTTEWRFDVFGVGPGLCTVTAGVGGNTETLEFDVL